MGGVDCGAALDTKSSPHRAAIAKTQEELRLEYDVREERRRELEFLEKGGNPLDYKFGRVASISVQSTSLRDQLAEHETKGSFALAASPHGDSAESSGRPTCSLGREPNIADNLLLFTGENSSPVREKITKRTGKRSNVAPAELSSKIDVCRNLKEPNDLVIFRRGPRGQAYARRNRSRSNWDSRINTFPLLPSPCMNDWDAKESHEQLPTEEHAFSSLTISKSTTPIAKRVQKSFGSKDQLCMDIDGEPTRYQIDTERPGLQVLNINSSENLKDLDHNATSVDQVSKSNFVQTSALIEKDSTASDGIISVPFCAIDNIKGSDHDENEKNLRSIDVVLSNGHENNITGEENVFNTVNEVAGRINPDLNFSSVSKAHFYGTTDGGDSLTIASPATYAPSKDETIILQAKFTKSVEVKDAAQLRAQAEEDSFSSIEIIKNNMPNNSQDDETDALRAGMINVSSTSHNHKPSSAILSQKVFSSAAELQNSDANQLRLAKRAHEDDILKQAQMVEATLKRAAVPSYSCISSENKKNWHWDFVLQEMAWMANDFMQERLWKTTAAAQVCNWIASVGITKFVQENIRQKQRSVARTLAKAVMNFWSSVRVILNEGEASSSLKDDIDGNLFKASNCSSLDAMKNQCIENDGRLHRQGIQTYALRLLHYLSDMSSDPILSEAPRTPDLIKDAGSFGVIWDDQQSEERLFYNVLPGAMRSYRELTESQRPYFKVEVCEASMCNSIADGSRGVALEEDVGETGADILSGGFEDKFLSKFSHKKNNICQLKLHNIRYEDGTDLTYEPCLDRKSASHSVLIMGKRPSGILNDTAVPTKRTRTAARQRIISPFTVGSVGALPVTSKTDVSSGDTSFQDEQSSRYGCSQPQKTLEVDSTVDFERFLSFESSDIPIKSKKKKKPKHFGYKNSLKHLDSKVLIVSDKASSYEQRLQVDYMVQQDQRDHTKKRCESRHFDSNGNIGFYGQNVVKKPKVPKRVESPEPFIRAGGSMPSPVASQMSNMSNSNKLIKIINNRDRGRKSKALKMAAGQSGYGIAWSTFEDQALVVLVHDMGLNWELVSDALNSTLHFKCIYRKALECKERHKFLMDKGAGDGADSAEDSGSSQPYPSTLPGIPKGSARQLFQRLQGPMEEDTMKSHFEKVILIGQRLHNCRTQDNKQQLRQIAPAHSSHVFVLSQACPNNLSGQILSPIDFSDAVNSNPDVVGLGYQGTHTNGFVIPGHQGSLAPVLTTSSANSVLQGSPNVVLGSGIPLTSAPVHTLPRDAQRYGVPRSSTLPVDEQKRLQQFNQNISGRNMQQSGISMTSTLPAGVDRGVRMLAGGNGMGMMCGVNHSMPIPRTGFQGASPTGCLNMVSSNNMLPSNVGISNPMGAHPSAVSVSGNTMIRPRDSLQMLRTTEEQRQIMMQEIQLQASQGNTQALSPYNGLSAPFSNAPVHPPVQTIPVQQHQASHQLPQPHLHGNSNNSHIQGTNHSSSQQQSYIRFAKESPLQRIVPQTQHPYSSSNVMSSLQSNSQLSQQNQSTSPVNSLSSLQPQHKQQPMPGNPQTSSMMSNQIMKQRQRQHVQQPQLQSRNLQQSKQQVQQQAKLIKGLGRGSMLMHQNVPVDATQVGGRPAALNNQASEKLAVQQSQGFNHGNTGINSNSQQSSIQQKLYSLPHISQSKQVSPPMPHSDTSQTSIQAPTHTIRPAHQSVQAAPTAPQQQQQQQQQRQANQSPTNMQRIILSQDRHLNHDNRMQPANNEPVPVNHLTPSPLLPKTADSSSLSAAVSSAVHWKPELSFETSSTGEKAQLNTLPQESSTGNDAVKPISTHSLGQRQLSGTISIHGHGVGSQWQQQRLQPTPVPQPHHRQGAQGNLCTRPSKTGQ